MMAGVATACMSDKDCAPLAQTAANVTSGEPQCCYMNVCEPQHSIGCQGGRLTAFRFMQVTVQDYDQAMELENIIDHMPCQSGSLQT